MNTRSYPEGVWDGETPLRSDVSDGSRLADRAGLKDAAAPSEAIRGSECSFSGAFVATFGRYLLERGVLGRAQLEDATQVMVIFGGRLGTILVEAGLLGVEEVEAHLSRHLGVPSAPPDRLLRPDPAALRRERTPRLRAR